MKESLVGFIKCNGLNGLSESHLFITQVNLKFQVVISLVSSCWGCLLGLYAGECKRKQDTCACQLTKPLFKKKKNSQNRGCVGFKPTSPSQKVSVRNALKRRNPLWISPKPTPDFADLVCYIYPPNPPHIS